MPQYLSVACPLCGEALDLTEGIGRFECAHCSGALAAVWNAEGVTVRPAHTPLAPAEEPPPEQALEEMGEAPAPLARWLIITIYCAGVALVLAIVWHWGL